MSINELTKKIIGAAFEISNVLGAGFLEKVYENAMAVELARREIKFARQHSTKVIYKNNFVGDYVIDLFVEQQVIVELKAVSELNNAHLAQCLNYLKAANVEIGLLINFGTPKVEIKRVINNYIR